MSRTVNRWFRRIEDGLDEALEVVSGKDGRGPFEGTFRDYIRLVSKRFEFYRHVNVLVDNLERVANGELKRLMVFLPPRHGKSECITRLFSGFFISKFPELEVGIASYSGEMAYGFSRNARGFFEEGGGSLAADAHAVREWRTPAGGGMWAAGVGGPLTGRGFHLGIVDDPIRGSEESESETQRLKLHEWFRTVFSTRAEPDAAIIVVCTRWHQEDLAGWLLKQEDEAAEGWHILHLDAIHEEEAPEFPESCTVEPDWREVGEALCPERYPIDVLEQKRRTMGTRNFAALYQQTPTPPDGLFFRGSWFKSVDQSPDRGQRIRYWDTAGTQDGGDYTVGVLMSKHNGTSFIEDVVRGQWSPSRRDGHILATAEADRQRYSRCGGVGIWVESEAGVAGSDRTQATIRLLAGHSVRSERPTGSKEIRADPFAAQAESGNVKIVRGDWNTAFLDELCSFPYSRHDDQVDAASGAFNKLAVRSVGRVGTFQC